MFLLSLVSSLFQHSKKEKKERKEEAERTSGLLRLSLSVRVCIFPFTHIATSLALQIMRWRREEEQEGRRTSFRLPPLSPLSLSSPLAFLAVHYYYHLVSVLSCLGFSCSLFSLSFIWLSIGLQSITPSLSIYLYSCRFESLCLSIDLYSCRCTCLSLFSVTFCLCCHERGLHARRQEFLDFSSVTSRTQAAYTRISVSVSLSLSSVCTGLLFLWPRGKKERRCKENEKERKRTARKEEKEEQLPSRDEGTKASLALSFGCIERKNSSSSTASAEEGLKKKKKKERKRASLWWWWWRPSQEPSLSLSLA